MAIYERALGPQHPWVADLLQELASLYRIQGRYTEAEPLLKRALAISETVLGPDHPVAGEILSILALLFFEQREWETAATYWRESTNLLIRRSRRGA
jgi:tetratricopeptide (TPR) repeat protein